jgi:hypothetical protein
MVRVMAEENLAERTRFRLRLKRKKSERLKREAGKYRRHFPSSNLSTVEG